MLKRSVASVILIVGAGVPAAALDRPQIPPPPQTLSTASRSNPAYPKLGPQLNQVFASRFSPSFVGDREAFKHLVREGEKIDIVVETKTADTTPVAAVLDSLGSPQVRTYRHLLFATVPIAQLPTIANLQSVHWVRRPFRSEPHVMSQGVAVHNADTMHSEGHTGQGVKIGVLDCGGFSGYQGLLGTELPASVTVWQGGGGDPVGSGVHGAACAEIVHDMAPDAELVFAHDDTEADYYAAVDWLIAQNVDIISYSCGWTGEFPFDGSADPHNPVNSKVEEARAAGILWVTSAGNSAEGDNYQATFDQIPGYNWHNFDGDWANGVFSWSGNAYSVHLTWDDWPSDPTTSGSTQDYSLELWYWNGTGYDIVATSDNPQNGAPGQIPYETFEFNPPVDEWYWLVINKVNTTRDCYLNLKKTPYGGFIHYNADRSLTVPADSPAAVTVGAAHWSSLDLEPFSSQGPTLGPGGTEYGGILKPDLVGADAVDSVTYGLSDEQPWPNGYGFFGTSAACPHVAGAAGVLLSEDPSLTADQLASRLTDLATDMGPVGPDTMYGHGLLHLASSLIFADGFESGDTSAW